MSKSPIQAGGAEPRERLMAAARQLFVSRGASNVGINEVIAAAGVARMTLYNNFPSKDDLISAVYQDMADLVMSDFQSFADAKKSEEENVIAIFDRLDGYACRADFRGCPLIHASLQMAEVTGPVYDIVKRYKKRLRDHVYGLLEESRKNRSELADQILILMDGAVTEEYIRGVNEPIAAAKRAASIMIRATD